MGQVVPKILSQPYSAIAPHYDAIMRDIDYAGWLAYLHRIFHKFRHTPRRILDLACGTGTCAVSLSAQGYDVLGIDKSEAMLEVARQKTQRKGAHIQYIRDTMEDFSVPQSVDTIICLFDSLNYILREERLLDACSSAFHALGRRGLFAFDVNTEYGLAKCWGSREFVREDEGIVSIWRNDFNPTTKVARLDLTLFVPRRIHYVRIDESHQERAYPLKKLKKSLQTAGFGAVHAFRHMTFHSPGSNTKRVMIVAIKQP
ncbi:hypothetical protein AMJ40_03945 [candidate division TA06 bacterium DG_26]|uniref:Methyltransferase domain-containing protein n=1 Tax=candidate division TA06 bacterium DG_26 TaxID=1703771 RepID=A0A0S7WJ25_UNCT6|nr:MAG: hypothetical protein AMJ40_03945 [candidate division TA06 bacterium DG_26]